MIIFFDQKLWAVDISFVTLLFEIDIFRLQIYYKNIIYLNYKKVYFSHKLEKKETLLITHFFILKFFIKFLEQFKTDVNKNNVK